MKHFKYNRLLIGLILLGLAAALVINWQRHQAEEASRTVELVMNYEDVVELALTEGVNVEMLAAQFKATGITSLAVYEATLENLNRSGKITAVDGAWLLHQYRTGTLRDQAWRAFVADGAVRADSVYITGQPDVLAEVGSDLKRRLSPDRVATYQVGSDQVLAAKANFEKLEKWNLGILTAELQHVADMGFYAVARPSNYSKVQSGDVEAVFARLAPFDHVSAVMFAGMEVLGYPDLLPMTAEHLKQRGLTLGMIEHPLQLQFLKQDGLLPLAAANEYRSARVYVIPKDEQPKLKMDDAVRRWVLTDQERNIRINLLRPYDKPEVGKSLVETNLAYVAKTTQALTAAGFTIGKAGLFQPLFPSRILLALICTGATAAGVLYLSLLRPFAARYQYVLTAILAVVLCIPVLTGGGLLVRQMAALASAMLFPALSMTWQLDCWRRLPGNQTASLGGILWRAVCSLTAVVGLSLIGGLYIAAVLGDIRFLLEMEIYRGVKLTFVAPLLLVTLTFLARYNVFDQTAAPVHGVWQQLGRVLDSPVRVKSLVALAMAAMGAWVFIGRSGHTAGVPVLGIELKLRAFLEQVMYARPRGKELLGHPAFFLAVLAVVRQWPNVLLYVLVIGATIAQGSLVETFAHIRTPVFMSVVRALDGLALGLLLGAAAVVCVQALQRAVSVMVRRRHAEHE